MEKQLNYTKNYKSNIYVTSDSNCDNSNDSRWKLALQNSKIGVWEWNPTNDSVYYSEESKNIIGYADSEIKNTSNDWLEKVHQDDIEQIHIDFNCHAEHHTDTYENEHRILTKNGNYKWILDRGKIIERNTNGIPIRAIGTHTDITKQKKYENSLKDNLKIITNQNKRLHNFTHIVSHNLKNHIGNFENILEFYDQSDSQEEKNELVGHLKTISEALTKSIVDLNDIINIKSKSDINEHNGDVNLHAFTEKVISSLSLDSKQKDVVIENLIDPDIALQTNPSYLESILYNLISNGIKYNDCKKESKITLKSALKDNFVKIMVSDNGIGIDLNKYKEKIFEMYQTFHGTQREDSRGIGLYIIKSQIEALNGTINVESALNKGTTFTLFLKK